MVLANLVRHVAHGSIIYIIAEDLNGLGLAYGTTNTTHLLNVPAARMGAFADAVDGFYAWIHTANGALAKQQLKLTKEYSATDFVPRALYARYLQDIWRETQEIAAQHNCSIKLVEATATRIRNEGELAVLTTRGDAIAVDKIVLAVGNETKSILPQVKSAHIIQNPWAKDVFTDAANWAAPVMLMGAGLTAVDTVLSLRNAGYVGEIIAFSRHGHWPEIHAATTTQFQFQKDELFAQQTLQQLVRYVRSKIHDVGEWRVVIDALRPHSQALWQKLSTRDQQLFITRLLSVWNVHRHRMAPEIFQQLATVRLEVVTTVKARVEDDKLEVILHHNDTAHTVHPSRVINCTGGEMNITRSCNPLLMQALADRVIEPHANGLGIAVDPQYRAWGAAHPNLYVIGTWMTGQFLESTAVPELRVQAAAIATALVRV
jgi:uncharacterized NAD(P)/FAD-binding protein YdhS